MINIIDSLDLIQYYVDSEEYGETYYIELSLEQYDSENIEGYVVAVLEGIKFSLHYKDQDCTLYVDGVPFETVKSYDKCVKNKTRTIVDSEIKNISTSIDNILEGKIR